MADGGSGDDDLGQKAIEDHYLLLPGMMSMKRQYSNNRASRLTKAEGEQSND
jgi:hypothetical protein